MTLLLCAASLLVSLLVLTLGLRWRQQWFIDSPNHRSLHEAPIPRIGGLLLVPVVLFACGVMGFWQALPQAGFYCAIAILMLWLLSVLDDAFGLSPLVRLLAHLVICGALCWLLAKLVPSYWWYVWCLYAIAALNFYNFMDGSDGIAALQGAAGFAACALFAALLWPGSGIASVACVITSVLLAFLWVNWQPARMFMGDAGSTALGLGAAVFAALFYLQDPQYTGLAVLPFLPFWLDAGMTLLKRIYRGEKFWLPHREHLYQRLILAGRSHRQVALYYGAASCVCSLLGLLIYLLSIVE